MKNQVLKIGFWGTPEIAAIILKKLTENGFKPEFVITKTDKPIGRKQEIINNPVKEFSTRNDIQILQPQKLKDENFLNQFKELKPDICIVAAYGKIIPDEYLSVPKFGFINVHPSLLPKYRGPSPIQSVILNGESETGVTIMMLDKEMDHGAILASREFSIINFQFTNSKDLEKKLAELGAELLIETLPKYVAGEIKPKEQDHAQATFCKILTKEDGKIDWNQTAEKIYNQVRALNPEPGVWTLYKGKTLKILEAKIYEEQPNHNHDQEYIGVVYEENGQIFIPCSVGHIQPLKVQLEGSRETDVKSFLNGHRDFIGSKLG